MISYEKITGCNNKKESVKCMVCNHYYFEDKFDYQPYVLNIKDNEYRVYISNIDKKEAMIIFKKSNLDDKGVL